MQLTLVTLLVPDYDEGIAFFVDGLGWTLLADEDQGRKRWVTVAPTPDDPALLLARATTDAQTQATGNQAGGRTDGRVAFFLQTDNFTRDATKITAAGGTLIEPPRQEPYGTVAQWRDPWGNLWDLIEPLPWGPFSSWQKTSGGRPKAVGAAPPSSLKVSPTGAQHRPRPPSCLATAK